MIEVDRRQWPWLTLQTARRMNDVPDANLLMSHFAYKSLPVSRDPSAKFRHLCLVTERQWGPRDFLLPSSRPLPPDGPRTWGAMRLSQHPLRAQGGSAVSPPPWLQALRTRWCVPRDGCGLGTWVCLLCMWLSQQKAKDWGCMALCRHWALWLPSELCHTRGSPW